MSTRKQFVKVVVPAVTAIPRGSNAVGGTVIGDYIDYKNDRVLVVEMPKVEKKAGAKKAKKRTGTIADFQPSTAEVTHGA